MRTYEQLQIEKLVSQGSNLQTTIESSLRAGLPLQQFAGFTTLADAVVNQIDEVDAAVVYDHAGQQIFIVIDRKNPKLPPPSTAIKRVKQNTEIDQDSTHTQIVLPLRNRFETVGSLVLVASRDGLATRLSSSFKPLLFFILALSCLFAIAVWFATPYLARSRAPWLQIGYALTFLAAAGGVVVTLVILYSDAVQGKVQASALTLSQRLSDVVAFNLRFKDMDGVERVFSEYQRLNPEISEASLLVDGIIQISSDAKSVGKPWIPNSNSFEYNTDLSRPDIARRVNLVVTATRAVVYEQVERSVRNFAALFVASAFLSGLFLQMASSMQRLRSSTTQPLSSSKTTISQEAGLIIVKPIFFLAVFLEHLLYSFLPKFMQEIAVCFGCVPSVCSDALHGLLFMFRS